MNILIASNNKDKIIEFRSVLEPMGHNVYSLKDLNINIEVEETGTTFKENAFLKAEAISKLTDMVVVADDSGLEVHALDNFPGVYSARFMENSTYEEKFVELNKMLKDKQDRTGNFACALCVMNLKKEPLYFEAVVNGIILEKSCGKGGFGYDPIFFYPPFNKTLAEVSREQKNEVSHRGKAIKMFVQYLKDNF